MTRFLPWLSLFGALTGCTITADDVEPALPATPVNQANTVAYHVNGIAVVAHNYTDLFTAIITPFIGPFSGGGVPVQVVLQANNTLIMSCVDAQNVVRPSWVQHGLTWQLAGFHGIGTYPPAPATTAFQLYTRDAADETWLRSPLQPLAVPAPAAVVVTEWNSTTRHLHGTFAMRFEATGGAPAAEVQDGSFDLTLAP